MMSMPIKLLGGETYLFTRNASYRRASRTAALPEFKVRPPGASWQVGPRRIRGNAGNDMGDLVSVEPPEHPAVLALKNTWPRLSG